MKQADIQVAMAVPTTGGNKWHELMLESLGVAGVEMDGCIARLEVPLPWRVLLFLERLLSRPKPDLFARTAFKTVLFEHAKPDLLVLVPGCHVSPEQLANLPLGVFEIEPIHPAQFGKGVLKGRLLWHRAGHSPRLAASTATCVQSPLPLSWASAHLAKMAEMPSRVLTRIEMEGEAFWERCPEAEPLPPFVPGLWDWLGVAARLAGYGLTRAWQDLFFRRQWYLASRPGNSDPARPGFASESFTPWYPPKGTGWADPVLFRRDGRTWLFIEEIPGRKKGVISVMEQMSGGGWTAPRRVLTEPFHLSYPNVFEHGGEMYMVPETAQTEQVRLYRATDFPGGWVLDRVLLDQVSATDATFLEHEGTWWMFVNLRARGGSSWDELHLYRSESRLGPFRPHPLNPVVSDVRRARPAGPFIRSGGRLYRPAQDSSGWYGRALAVMEITRLDERGYEEREVSRLEPTLIPGSFCLHTFDSEGGLEIVDGQRRVLLWR